MSAPRESLLNLVERSITGERLVEELTQVFAVHGGPPKLLRPDNGPEVVSRQQFCETKAGMVYIPPGYRWGKGYIELFNNRLRGVPQPQLLEHPLRGRAVIGDFKHEHTHRHRHSALATARQPSTLPPPSSSTPRWPAASIEEGSNQPDSRTGWTQERGLARFARFRSSTSPNR